MLKKCLLLTALIIGLCTPLLDPRGTAWAVLECRWTMAAVGVLVGLLVLVQSPAEATSHASLTFPCRYTKLRVVCTLSGHHFYPRERVRIVYTVFASPAQGAKVVATYRRRAVTDARGNFTRPAFWTSVDPRNGFAVTVTVAGVRGDRASTAAGGAS